MTELSFNGISKSDMKYVDYLAKNDFHGFAMLCVETDLSASHRIKKLEQQGYLFIKNGEVCFSFDAVIALTDYRNYLKEQEHRDRQSFFRQWIPVAISSFLSVTAILISIIALLKP